MVWFFPGYYWMEIIPGLLLVGWLLSELQFRRRLRRFGDARILGIAFPWLPRLAAAMISALGVALAAAILPLPATGGKTPISPVTNIVFDLPASRAPDPGGNERAGAAVRALFAQTPEARFRLLASEPALGTLVPATADTKGFEMLLEGLPAPVHPRRSETLAALQERVRRESAESQYVVLTGLPARDLERIPVSRPLEFSRILFVLPAAEGRGAAMGRRAANGTWLWATAPDGWRRLIFAAAAASAGSPGLSPVQRSALLAMLFLGIGFMCRYAGRSRAKEPPYA